MKIVMSIFRGEQNEHKCDLMQTMGKKLGSTMHDATIGCVRLSSLGQPRSAPVGSNSFDVTPWAHPGQPPSSLACGVGHLGLAPGA